VNIERLNRGSAAGVGIIIVGASFAIFTLAAKLSHPVPAVDADRGAQRSQALAEIRAAEDQSLNNAGTIDAARGVVRLPIDRAMELAAQAAKDPAAARASLNARAEKAAAELPKAPEKPSIFE
jgi:hypothetical protein